MRIRSKILLGFFLIFLATILAGTGILYFQVKQSLERGIENELSNSSRTLMEMVRTAVDVSIRNRLRAVAEKNREIVAGLHARELAGTMTRAEAQARAVEIFSSQVIGRTGYIYCLNSQGSLAWHPVPELIGVNVSQYEFIREQKARREGYLEYYWRNPGEGAPRPKALYMSYFEPWDWIISASTYREEFRSLINVEDFRRAILSQRFGEQGYAVVFDTAGNAVIHPFLSGNAMHVLDASGKSLVGEVVARKFGKLRYMWKNPGETTPREKLMIFNYLPEVDWIVGATGYADDFFAPLRALRVGVLVVVPVVLLLGLPFSLWIGLSVSRPITELQQGFSRAAEGDFGSRVEPGGVREVDELAAHFNGFMQRMEEYSTSLRREVRDRRQAEEREAGARAFLRDVVDSMPSIIIGLDSERRITLWNRRAAEQFGLTAEEAAGLPASEACRAYGLFEDVVDVAMRERRPVVRDKIPGRQDGLMRYSVLEVFPLSASAEPGVVVRIADVTDRVRMEEMMVQTEKMMSVGGLAAGMAHEINNPLGGILQGVQNIVRRLSSDLPGNRRAAEEAGLRLESLHTYMAARDVPAILDGIRDCGLRAARIVTNMLEFSRRSESKRALCSVPGLLDKAVELAESDYDLKKRYDFKKIRVERDYEEGLPPVNCSATEIEQVFLNLMRNAAQAMGGAQALREPLLRLAARREGSWVRIEIADNGPGMDEATRRRIFEPFFTTKNVGEGTGLGLSVSYFIISQNHGGTFAVDSEPGQGATFVIRLPL